MFLPLIQLGLAVLSKPGAKLYQMTFKKGLVVKIWDRPGLSCSNQELDEMVQDMETIIKNSHDKEVPKYGVFLDDRRDFDLRLITIVYDKKRPVAFSAQAYLECEVNSKKINVVHLGLVYVDRSVRQKGFTGLLYTPASFLLLLKSRLSPITISNVTQVPAIFGLVEDFYSNAYPNTKGLAQSSEQYQLGLKIAQNFQHIFGVGKDSHYDPHEQIIYNSYTGGSNSLKKTFSESSKYRNPIVNELCFTKLNYERGDDYLQLAQLDLKLLFRFLTPKFKFQQDFKTLITRPLYRLNALFSLFNF
jgi:hypothetical protein